MSTFGPADGDWSKWTDGVERQATGHYLPQIVETTYNDLIAQGVILPQKPKECEILSPTAVATIPRAKVLRSPE